MTGSESALAYRRLRAPREHGQALIEPPFAQIASLLTANRQALSHPCLLLDRPTTELQLAARREMIDAARQFTAAYRDIAIPDELLADNRPTVMLSGHQPQLFHAGVWFKNFALSQLAAQHRAVAVNLSIDNDLSRTADLRVPQRRGEQIVFEAIAADKSTAEVPLEERPIVDQSQFAAFGDRVAETLGDLVPQPLIRRLWPLARQAARGNALLGASLAQARHALEAQFGLQTLELPLSAVCRMGAFRHFAAHLLCDASRFRAIHNEALTEYRQIHRIRSRAHPAPPLSIDGDWVETPFWIWSSRDPTRRRLFARQHSAGNSLELTDRRGTVERLEIGGDKRGLVDQQDDLEQRGVRIRPRALTTTMFARLLLCDLFAHGIGGAKYDQLTDEILIRYFGCPPTGFVVLTATAHLPLPLLGFDADALASIERKLREIRFQPEKHIKSTAEVVDLLQQKRRWLSQAPPRGAGKPRREALERINQQLQPALAEERLRLETRRGQLVAARRIDRQLLSREFSFCLHSEQTLPDLLLELSGKQS